MNAIIRCLLFWVACIAGLYGMGAVTAMLPSPWPRPAHALVATLLAFLVIRKEWAILIKFTKGILIGAGLFTLIVLALSGTLQWQKNPAPLTWLAIPAFISILLFAFIEEVIFRSYTFVTLNNTFGLWITQFIVAIAFALYHIIGGWNIPGAVMGPGIWAFVFGLAAIWSGGVAMPTGIHFALNILQVLTGMKGAQHAIFLVSMKQTDQLGIVMHLIVFAGAIVLTAVYVKKMSRPHAAAGTNY